MIVFANPSAAWLLLLPVFIFYIFPDAAKMYGDALQVPFVKDIMAMLSNGHIGFEFRSLYFTAITPPIRHAAWVCKRQCVL